MGCRRACRPGRRGRWKIFFCAPPGSVVLTGRLPPTIRMSTVRSIDVLQLLRAAERQTKAGHHFVIDEERAVLLGEAAQRCQEVLGRRDQPHVADDRFEDYARDLGAVGRERVLQARDIVVAQDQRVLRAAFGTLRLLARRCRRAGAGGDEQATTWPGSSRRPTVNIAAGVACQADFERSWPPQCRN